MDPVEERTATTMQVNALRNLPLPWRRDQPGAPTRHAIKQYFVEQQDGIAYRDTVPPRYRHQGNPYVFDGHGLPTYHLFDHYGPAQEPVDICVAPDEVFIMRGWTEPTYATVPFSAFRK
jgi:hypothetical protein